MKVGIWGYGRMGRMVESILSERNYESIVLEKNCDKPEDIDVIIEFSRPECVVQNLRSAMDWNIPIVTGTTGWNDQLAEISKEVQQKNSAVFYASNFSIGVNVFLAASRHLSRIMNQHPDYDARIVEIHHTSKLDSPSGTAITLAEHTINELDGKSRWANEATSDKASLDITSSREADVPGTHRLIFENEIDKITIEHLAKGRRGFALGAVMAAEWLKDRKGLYTMSDMLEMN